MRNFILHQLLDLLPSKQSGQERTEFTRSIMDRIQSMVAARDLAKNLPNFIEPEEEFSDINEVDSAGETVLLKAVKHGSQEITEKLLQICVTSIIDIADATKKSPLYYAVQNQDLNAVRNILLVIRKNIIECTNTSSRLRLITKFDEQFEMAKSAASANLEVLRELKLGETIQRGIGLISRLSVKDGSSAQKLLEQKEDIDFTITDVHGQSALVLACDINEILIVNLILNHTSNQDVVIRQRQLNPENLEQSPLVHAAKCNGTEVMKLLVAAGALIYAVLKRQDTAEVGVQVLLELEQDGELPVGNKDIVNLSECMNFHRDAGFNMNIILGIARIPGMYEYFVASCIPEVNSPEIFNQCAAVVLQELDHLNDDATVIENPTELQNARALFKNFREAVENNKTIELDDIKVQAILDCLQKQLIFEITYGNIDDVEWLLNNTNVVVTKEIIIESILPGDTAKFEECFQKFAYSAITVESFTAGLMAAIAGFFAILDRIYPKVNPLFEKIATLSAIFVTNAVPATICTRYNTIFKSLRTYNHALVIQFSEHFKAQALRILAQRGDVVSLRDLMKDNLCQDIISWANMMGLVLRDLTKFPVLRANDEIKNTDAEQQPLPVKEIIETLFAYHSTPSYLGKVQALPLLDFPPHVLTEIMSLLHASDYAGLFIALVQPGDKHIKLNKDDDLKTSTNFKIIFKFFREFIKNTRTNELTLQIVSDFLNDTIHRLVSEDTNKYCRNEIIWLVQVKLLFAVELNDTAQATKLINEYGATNPKALFKLDLNIRNLNEEPLILIAERNRNHQLLASLLKELMARGPGATMMSLAAIKPIPQDREKKDRDDLLGAPNLKLIPVSFDRKILFNDILFEEDEVAVFYTDTVLISRQTPAQLQENKDEDLLKQRYGFREPNDALSLAVHTNHLESKEIIIGNKVLFSFIQLAVIYITRALIYAPKAELIKEFVQLIDKFPDAEAALQRVLLCYSYQPSHVSHLQALMAARPTLSPCTSNKEGDCALTVAAYANNWTAFIFLLNRMHEDLRAFVDGKMSLNKFELPGDYATIIQKVDTILAKCDNESIKERVQDTKRWIDFLKNFTSINDYIGMKKIAELTTFFSNAKNGIKTITDCINKGHFMKLSENVISVCKRSPDRAVRKSVEDFEKWLKPFNADFKAGKLSTNNKMEAKKSDPQSEHTPKPHSMVGPHSPALLASNARQSSSGSASSATTEKSPVTDTNSM